MRRSYLRSRAASCGSPLAFTLLEMLVAMAVVALLLVLVFQILSGTTATVAASNKQLDTASIARIVLDRFGNDFSGMILTGGATALYYTEPGDDGNSAIAFVANSRARGPTFQSNPWTTDTRAAFIGYRIRSVAQYIGSSSPALPCLNRGDARLTLSVQDMGNRATANLWDVFGTGSPRIPNDLTADSASDQRVLDWQVVAASIFRMHMSFVLNDGTIVQTPPAYRNFFASGNSTGNCVPIAFSGTTSADANRRYVKALIVGIAGLDPATRNLAYRSDNSFWTTIGTQIRRPTSDSEVPAQIWNQNIPGITFAPARQNLRVYQRFYSVSL